MRIIPRLALLLLLSSLENNTHTVYQTFLGLQTPFQLLEHYNQDHLSL